MNDVCSTGAPAANYLIKELEDFFILVKTAAKCITNKKKLKKMKKEDQYFTVNNEFSCRSEDYDILYFYICGFGANLTPTDDNIMQNLPSIVVPQDEVTKDNVVTISDTFGKISAENHNVYE